MQVKPMLVAFRDPSLFAFRHALFFFCLRKEQIKAKTMGHKQIMSTGTHCFCFLYKEKAKQMQQHWFTKTKIMDSTYPRSGAAPTLLNLFCIGWHFSDSIVLAF